MWLERDSGDKPCDDGPVLYIDCGGGDPNLDAQTHADAEPEAQGNRNKLHGGCPREPPGSDIIQLQS